MKDVRLGSLLAGCLFWVAGCVGHSHTDIRLPDKSQALAAPEQTPESIQAFDLSDFRGVPFDNAVEIFNRFETPVIITGYLRAWPNRLASDRTAMLNGCEPHPNYQAEINGLASETGLSGTQLNQEVERQGIRGWYLTVDLGDSIKSKLIQGEREILDDDYYRMSSQWEYTDKRSGQTYFEGQCLKVLVEPNAIGGGGPHSQLQIGTGQVIHILESAGSQK